MKDVVFVSAETVTWMNRKGLGGTAGCGHCEGVNRPRCVRAHSTKNVCGDMMDGSLGGSSRAMKPRGEFLFVLAAVIVMVLHVTVWSDYTYM